MPGGVVTSRIIIIAPVENARAINDVLLTVDPTNVGDPLNTPLRLVGDDTNTVVALWANWPMDNTDRSEFNRSVAQLTRSERTVHANVDNVPAWGTQRVWLFDGLAVSRYQAWAVLGLEPPVAEE